MLIRTPQQHTPIRQQPQSQKPNAPEPEQPSDSFLPRVLGAVTGGVLGALAGRSGGAGGATAAAGLGAVAVTGAIAVPYFSNAVKEGMNGDLINDLSLVCGTTFAGGVLIASSGAGAGALMYPLALAIPGAAPILGAIVGAAAGYGVGSRF